MKKCSTCNEVKDLNYFEKSKSCKDGYRNTCKLCRAASRKKYSHICKNCSKEFKNNKKEAKFCSSECAGNFRSIRVKSKCAYCNNDIYVIPSKFNKHEKLYCTKDCRYNHLKQLIKGKNNYNYSSIDYNCDGCDANMKVNPYRLSSLSHAFCSHECYKKNIGKFYTGENNPNWNPNLTEEDRERLRNSSHDEWAKKVKHRDNYKCVCCGSNKSGTLISHHLNSYNWDKEHRYDINNGVTLCNSCHKEFHLMYGYGDNTKKQFESFLNTVKHLS